jgi:hypothetical protein
MNPAILAAIVVSAAILVAVILVSRAEERKRTDALRELASMLGFAFDGDTKRIGQAGLDGPLTLFKLFKHGGAPRVRNVMRAAVVDGEDLVFDFAYTVSTGKSSHTVDQTVAAFRRRAAQLPAFSLSPENVFSKIGHLFGGQDIDFDSNAEFSSAYVLKGDDAGAVRACFERQAVMYFADRPGWSAEGHGEWLILYRHAKREKPEDLREWLDEVRRAARALDPR